MTSFLNCLLYISNPNNTTLSAQKYSENFNKDNTLIDPKLLFWYVVSERKIKNLKVITMVDWDSMGRVITQTRDRVF